MTLRTGSIVKHRFRKEALYLLVVEGPNQFHMARVKKQQGYPLSAEGRYRESDPTKLTEVDYAPQYANFKREDCARHNYRDTAILPQCTSRSQIPDGIWNTFLSLACSLSPENLSCDGELSRSQIISRRNQIMREWQQLEKQVGYSVSESFIWNEELKKLPN